MLQLGGRPAHRIVRHRVHQAEALGFRRIHFLRRCEHLQGAGFADEAGQALRAAPAGNQTEGGAAMTKHGVRPGHTVVAGERQVQAAAHAVAVNSGADRGREAGNQVHEFLPSAGKFQRLGAIKGGDFMQVGPGREELVVTGDDQRFGGARQVAYGAGQLQHAGAGEAIGIVR